MYEVAKVVHIHLDDCEAIECVLRCPRSLEDRRACCYQTILQDMVPESLESLRPGEYHKRITTGGFVVTESDGGACSHIDVTWVSS